MKSPSNGMIALVCVVCCVGLTVFIFSESRNDPGLRMAALVSSTSIAAALIAIASTLLVGKDVTKPDPADLPPGSIATSSTQATVQVPPTAAVNAKLATGIEKETNATLP